MKTRTATATRVTGHKRAAAPRCGTLLRGRRFLRQTAVLMNSVITDWRSRSALSWARRKANLVSRKETGSPEYAECDAAMSTWRLHDCLVGEFGLSEAKADSIIAAATVADFVDAQIAAVSGPETPEGEIE